MLEFAIVGLIIVFVYFFWAAATGFNSACSVSEARENAERELAARFIRNAINQYEQRHTRPDLTTMKRMEELTDEMDDLVEIYINQVKGSTVNGAELATTKASVSHLKINA